MVRTNPNETVKLSHPDRIVRVYLNDMNGHKGWKPSTC
jgi:hypothetical protein